MATGSTLTVLATDLLSDLDLYNANDLSFSTVGTSGYQAMKALNKALQKLYSKMQDTYLLKTIPVNSTKSTTADQDYVDISSITALAEIENIYEASNDLNLEKISFEEYRRRAADPSSSTGNPLAYARRDTYLYIYPRPDAVYTLNIYHTKIVTDLATGADTSAIPSRYNYLILDWAKVEWQVMQDASDTARIAAYQAQADRSWEIAWEDIQSKFAVYEESDSYWDQGNQPQFPPFDSPVGS